MSFATRDAALLQHAAGRLGMVEAHDDHGHRLPAEQGTYEVFFGFHIIVSDADDRLIARIASASCTPRKTSGNTMLDSDGMMTPIRLDSAEANDPAMRLGT